MSPTQTPLLKSAHSSAGTPEQVAEDLIRQLGEAPAALTLFFSPKRDGAAIAKCLRARWPKTHVVGCSTAGELSTGRITTGGVSAGALPAGLVGRVASALASFADGVPAGIRGALAALESQLGVPLASLDPSRHVGLIFVDSTHAVEDAALVALGEAAPLLRFVGGSAADDLAFVETRVLAQDRITSWGCALMVLEVPGPFEVLKLCHFEPTGKPHEVTRVRGRLLLELDGRPAAEVYAERLGVKVEELTLPLLAAHPAGLVIAGEPWVRQATPPVIKEGGITLGCELVPGQKLHFFKHSDDLTHHFQTRMAAADQRLGGLRGVLMFDCGLRRLELEHTGATGRYAEAIRFPAAGFHTHGEQYIGHMHQTLTALAFG